MYNLEEKCINLKKSYNILSTSTENERNNCLQNVSDTLLEDIELILEANKIDVENARKIGMKDSLIDRLFLDEKRLKSICDSIKTIINLNDPLYTSETSFITKTNLNIKKVHIPIGIIAIIYESRPNVTIDSFALCIKTGNPVLLRGSSSAINSNIAIINSIKKGIRKTSFPDTIVEFVDNTDRQIVNDILINHNINLLIPRGGKNLIDFVTKNAKIPVLETGAGNCHIFVDESADLNKSLEVILNAKLQRLGTCNTVESLLIHKSISKTFIPLLKDLLHDVEFRGCSNTCKIIDCKLANDEDYFEEFLDKILSIKIVENVDDAINHINKYSSGHSEAILTNNLENANKFTRNIDSACVYVNASTRFTDGGEFGFGCEMGISTNRIHARGPVGLKQLVTYKYVIDGNYSIRK